MQKEIKYIGFYQNPLGKSKRNHALPATNKMDYIAYALYEAGYNVHMVTPSSMVDGKEQPFFERTQTHNIFSWKKVTAVSSWRTSTKWGGYFKIIWSLFWLFSFLVIKVKRNEKILVYHSPWLALPIILAKRIRRFHLILEVEEIYSDISSLHPYFDKLELKLIDVADSFLLSTDLLVNKFGHNRKSLIIYGDYSAIDLIEKPINDGKIHLIYAGIIDSIKAGAFNALESSLYLDDKYILHIIGFGETELLEKRIKDMNKTAKCKIIFDGLLSGEEYIKYCQKCHIGLSTQKMDGAYLESSFPSKILSYLGMGLKVVSCKIECVEKSKIGDQVVFYDNDSPISIAEAIRKVDLNASVNPRERIMELHLEFVNGLKELITH